MFEKISAKLCKKILDSLSQDEIELLSRTNRYMRNYLKTYLKNMLSLEYFAKKLSLLKYVHTQVEDVWNTSMAAYAASNMEDDTECLKYLHENGCPWDKFTCKMSASRGNIRCLKYAHENGCPWDEEAYLYAALEGRLGCLQYLHDSGCPQPWTKKTCYEAAAKGSLDILKCAHENGVPWIR